MTSAVNSYHLFTEAEGNSVFCGPETVDFEIVAIDTPGGNLSLKIKSRAQQITLKPNIIKVKILIS
jgi:hypothetical protein